MSSPITANVRHELSSGDLPTEARLLEVASRLFYERGYYSSTMRDLAEQVGIKAASLYNHFSGKQEILVRICLAGQREFLEGATLCLEGLDDVRKRLRTLIVWQVGFEAQNPYKARVADAQLAALNPVSRREVIEVRDAYERLLTSVLVEGNDAGYWRIENPRVICMGIIGMCKVRHWYRNSGA